VAGISVVGRNTQGVRLIRLDEGDTLVGLDVLQAEEGEA
jgi:DNA gyrase subunit A